VSLKEIAEKLAIFGVSELWLAKVITVLGLTVLIHFISTVILVRLLRATKKTRSTWDDALIIAAFKSLPALIWVIGISMALLIIGQYIDKALLETIPVARNIGITICLAWFAWRLVSEGSKRYLAQQQAQDEEIDRTTVDALSKLGHLIIIVTTLLTVMQTLGVSVSGLLAVGGVGGIAVGFAAKDILANFFGGFTIYMDRPFVVGDWIRSPDKDIEGTVEKISWRYTQIRRFNKNPIYVPNSIFTTIAVENPSRMSNRRIKETIGIRYVDIKAMPAIVSEIKTMLKNHPDIDQSTTLIVNFNAFSSSSIDIFVYAFSRTTVWEEFHGVKQDVLLKIADIVAKHGAEIAFPTQTIHIADQG
jgi:MscS family membrane protein